MTSGVESQSAEAPAWPGQEWLGAAWRARVEAEYAQAERLREWREADHYAPIAQSFVDDPRRDGDRLLDALLALTRPDASWLDVGAGGGRFALPLALRSRHVIAVEPSPGMRAVLTESMQTHGIANVELQAARWPEEAGDLSADFSLIAHVGYDIRSINTFLDALEAATRERCVAIMMDRAPSSGFTALWEQVHGERRADLPGVRELLQLLLARGALPEARLFPRDLPTLTEDEVRDFARRRLWLTEGSPKDRRLQELLTVALRNERYDFGFPMTIALLTWAPRHVASAPGRLWWT